MQRSRSQDERALILVRNANMNVPVAARQMAARPATRNRELRRCRPNAPQPITPMRHVLSRSTIAAAAATFLALGALLVFIGFRVLAPDPTASADTLTVPAADRVVERLHEEGLVMDLEVRDSMIALATRYQAGEMSREIAAEQLLAWIDHWEASHPDRAEAARARFASLRAPTEAPPIHPAN